MLTRPQRTGYGLGQIGVLSCLSIIVAAAPAHAATPVFVDAAGMCAGLTPCFTTIQAGVNNAGPPPAVVNVFPGTYAESVDLSLMGSAIGGSPGDLTLRTVDAAGVPTPGTASITPAAGAALRSTVSPYPGNITIDGFTVKSPNVEGIGLQVIQGTLSVIGVVSDGNGTTGLSAAIDGGDLRIRDSSFSNNLNGNGITVATPMAVTFERVTADGNQGFGASLAVSGAVHITDSSFSNSIDSFGLSFATATDVTLDGVTADANKSFGASFALDGPVRILDSSFSNNSGFGLSFATATSVTLADVAAAGNRLFNASFATSDVVHITDSNFSNSMEGFGLSFASATDAVLERVTADGNMIFNGSFALTGRADIANSSFSHSKTNFGLSFASAADASLAGVTVDGNKSFGASLSVANTLRIVNSSFSGSVDLFGLSFVSPASVTLLSVVADGNKRDGVTAVLQSGIISGSRFANNGQTGVVLNLSEPFGMVRLRCNDILGNGTGLRLLDDATVDAASNYWGAPSGPTHPSNPAGTGDSIADGANGGAGTVIFQPFLTTPSAESEVCQPRGAPALGAPALTLLLLALLVLPAWRLSRRDARPSGR